MVKKYMYNIEAPCRREIPKNKKFYKGFYLLKNGDIACYKVNNGQEFGKIYKVGKTHRVTGILCMCFNGMHCCENLYNVDGYYPFSSGVGQDYIDIVGDIVNHAYCEVIPSGRIIYDRPSCDKKVCCSVMFVKKRLSNLEILKQLFSELNSCEPDLGDIYNSALGVIKEIYENFTGDGITIFGRYDIMKPSIMKRLEAAVNKFKNAIVTSERFLDQNLMETKIKFLEDLIENGKA